VKCALLPAVNEFAGAFSVPTYKRALPLLCSIKKPMCNFAACLVVLCLLKAMRLAASRRLGSGAAGPFRLTSFFITSRTTDLVPTMILRSRVSSRPRRHSHRTWSMVLSCTLLFTHLCVLSGSRLRHSFYPQLCLTSPSVFCKPATR